MQVINKSGCKIHHELQNKFKDYAIDFVSFCSEMIFFFMQKSEIEFK